MRRWPIFKRKVIVTESGPRAMTALVVQQRAGAHALIMAAFVAGSTAMERAPSRDGEGESSVANEKPIGNRKIFRPCLLTKIYSSRRRDF